jgi:hypothetical protein
MQKPALRNEHERLRELAGDWEGTEHLGEPFKPGTTAHGSWHCRAALEGLYLIMDYTQTMDERVSMLGHAVVGFDDKQDCYTLHWFDTFSEPPKEPDQGKCQNGRLVFEHAFPSHERRTTLERMENGIHVKVEMRFEGEDWVTSFEGTYGPPHVPSDVRMSA